MKDLYPKRDEDHIAETESWTILQSVAPRDWMVRQLTERDYGIDAYIEMPTAEGYVAGDLFSAQLKSKQQIKWNKTNGEAGQIASFSVKTTTARYWLSLQVPVFLFVVDLSTRLVHFSNVKEAIRRSYEKLDDQDSFSFRLHEQITLNSAEGLELFKVLYQRERAQEHFAHHTVSLVGATRWYSEFMEEHQGRDGGQELEALTQLEFRSIYQSCRAAALYIDFEWPIESLIDIYKSDGTTFKYQEITLHEKTMDRCIARLAELYPRLVRSALELVTKTEGRYWRTKDPVLFSLCQSSDVGNRIRSFESEFGR